MSRLSFKSLFIIIIFLLIPIILMLRLRQSPNPAAAGWFNDSWQYRQRLDITNSSGTNLTEFQVSLSVGTSALIAAGKMQTNCNDIRVTDNTGQLLPQWIETGAKGCNSSSNTTYIWVKTPSLPASGGTIFLYYGNSIAPNVENGNNVFEFFDDFSSSTINSTKWSQGTIAATSGTNFSQSAGNLVGGNTNRYIQSTSNFSGNYSAEARIYETTTATNGFTSIGFYASSTNNFGILSHNTTSYYRNDSSWVNFAFNGQSQWSRDSVKVVGTSATYARIGETSGSATNTGTNSGISSEYLRLSPRYDDSATNQNYAASWDWIFVRKTIATNPTATAASEEVSPAPAAYWKFDEGVGTSIYDSSPNQYNGLISGATWITEDQCVSGKCLQFSNTNINTKDISINDSALLRQTHSHTITSWFNLQPQPSANSSYKILVVEEGSSGASLKAQFIAAGFNVIGDTGVANISQVAAYSPDIVLCDTYAWGCTKQSLYNSLYDAGYNIITKGNDTNTGIYPIATAHSGTHSNTTISPDEKHPLGVGWTSTGNSGADGGKIIDTINTNAISIAKNQDGFTELIYLEEPNKGRWFHYQALGNVVPTLFSNIVSYLLRYNLISKGKNYNLYTYNGNIYGFLNNQKVSGPITYNKWNQIQLVYNQTNNNISLNLNGSSIGSTSYTTDLDTDTRKISIGSFTKGYLDEVKIYPYARTDAQIKTDYNAGKAHASSNKGIAVNLGSNVKNSEAFSDGLVGYWKMDEGVGTTTLDSSGNSNTATFATGDSAPSWGNGKYGVGISFVTANNQKLNVGSSINIANSSFTLSVFSKRSSTGGQIIIGQGPAGTSTALHFGFAADNTFGCKFYSNDLATTTAYTDTNWHHWVCTYDASNKSRKIYQDGILVAQDTASANYQGTGTLYLGSRWDGTSSFYNGLLDEVRIYNRALQPAEVTQLYNWAPGPIAYWNMDEGVGTSAYDQSGNNLHTGWNGTLTTPWVSGKYGKAFTLNGSNNYGSVNSNALLNITGDITISAWVKATTLNSNYRQIVFKGTTSSRQYGLRVDNWNRWQALYNIGGTANYIGGVSASTATLNQWTHLAWTRIGSLSTLYMNGVSVATGTQAGSIDTTEEILAIGRLGATSAEYFAGLVDDVKIYNYGRTSKQITEDMNAGHPAGGSPVGSQIAYYKFDEGYGTITQNSGNGGIGLSGAFSGSPTWSSNGKYNKAINFSSSNYVYVPHTTALNPSSDFTISAWINPSSNASYQGVIKKMEVGSNVGYRFTLRNDGTIWCDTGNESGSSGSQGIVTYSANTWQYFACVRSGSQILVYKNGVLTHSANTSSSAISATTNLFFGNNSSEFFNGTIDEVKIYNFALTAEEIKIDYNKGSAIGANSFSSAGTGNTAPTGSAGQLYCVPGDSTPCAPPIAEWNLDENSGSASTDKSGNGNDLTFGAGTSSPSWAVGKFNSALNFNGTNYAYRTMNPNLGNNITLDLWYKPQGNGVFLDRNWGWILMSQSGNQVSFTCNCYPAITANSSLNNWHHATGICNASAQTMSLYIDGTLASSVGCTQPSFGTNPITLGAVYMGQGGNYYQGLVDQVRIYDYARTPAQIAWDYNRGAPTGWWKFDECQGNIAYDSSGVGNTGLITIGAGGSQPSLGTCSIGGTTAWGVGATGKINSSLSFDGTDDNVAIPITAINGMDIKGPISYSAWFKRSDNGTYQTIISKIDACSGTINGFVLRIDANNSLNFFGWKGTSPVFNAYYTNSIILDTTNWHHVIATWDGTTNANGVNLYFDGKYVSSATSTANSFTSLAGINQTIGSLTCNAHYFAGKIDDVRVYNYALTSEQIKTVYNNGAVNFN